MYQEGCQQNVIDHWNIVYIAWYRYLHGYITKYTSKNKTIQCSKVNQG